MDEYVVLVDEHDHEVGVQEKLRAHVAGQLHRAFSAFVFNAEGHLLLQQRSRDKYHTGGCWSNTCCSHPRPDEPVKQAAQRRLQEEMGFTCELTPAFSFVYEAELGTLVEHEYDHVLVGYFDRDPAPNPREVANWRWISPDALRSEVERHPTHFTPWFRLSFERVLEHVADPKT